MLDELIRKHRKVEFFYDEHRKRYWVALKHVYMGSGDSAAAAIVDAETRVQERNR